MLYAARELRRIFPKYISREIALYAWPHLVGDVDDPVLIKYAMANGFMEPNPTIYLTNAITKNHLKVAEYLINKGAVSSYEHVKLIVDLDLVDMFRLLRANGVYTSGDDFYIFKVAYSKKLFKDLFGIQPIIVAEYLLKQPGDVVVAKFIEEKYTRPVLLELMIRKDKSFCIQKLAKYIDLNAALKVAFRFSSFNVIELLVSLGADINIYGSRYFNEALNRGCVVMAECCVNLGMHITSVDVNWEQLPYVVCAFFVIDLLKKKQLVEKISNETIKSILCDKPIENPPDNYMYRAIAAKYGSFENFEVLWFVSTGNLSQLKQYVERDSKKKLELF